MRSIIFKIAIVSLLVSLIGIIWVSLAFASAPTVAANYHIPTSTVTSINIGTSCTVIPPVSLVSAGATTATANSPIPTNTVTSISIGTSCTVIP